MYFYFPNGPSAYEAYDEIALGRVPRERISERDAYEFFAGRKREESLPLWTCEFDDRQPVFEDAGRCVRPKYRRSTTLASRQTCRRLSPR